MNDVRGIAIGIPAHDEGRRASVGPCGSVLVAARTAEPVVVVVAADSCNDDTESIARAELRDLPANVEAHVVESTPAARASRASMPAASRTRACSSSSAGGRRVGSRRRTRTRTVPLDWLSTHRRWARPRAPTRSRGSFASTRTTTRARPVAHTSTASSRVGAGHHHVFGANLGVSAAWWHRVGGVPADRGRARTVCSSTDCAPRARESSGSRTRSCSPAVG